MKQISNNGYIAAIVTIGFLFFVLGFAIGINTYLIPFLRGVFQLSTATSYLIMAATFSSFVVFGIPAGLIIKRIGYKGGIVLSFFVLALGMLLFVPSAKFESFPLFLLALFVGGIGQTLLQTSINPYITILGPVQSAATRICYMGISNKVAYALGPIILSLFLSLSEVDIADVIHPFYAIAAVFLLGALVSFFAPLPEITAENKSEDDVDNSKEDKTSIFQYPHLFLGAIAVFLYIGVETLSLGTPLDYATQVKLPELIFLGINFFAPEIFVSYATLSMIIGYLGGIILIPKYISQANALAFSSVLGIMLSILIIVLPSTGSVLMVAVLGIANAVMWPSIWPLSLEGLGKFTKTGSSILVIGVVGGAVVALFFGWLVDQIGYQYSYLLCFPCYFYLLFFAVKGHTYSKRVC